MCIYQGVENLIICFYYEIFTYIILKGYYTDILELSNPDFLDVE